MLEHFADLAGLEVSQLLPPKLGTLLMIRPVEEKNVQMRIGMATRIPSRSPARARMSAPLHTL